MGGPEMAPNTPNRSSRTGEAVARLDPPILEDALGADEEIDRRRRCQESLDRVAGLASVHRERPERLVAGVEQVVDAREDLDLPNPRRGSGGDDHRVRQRRLPVALA